MCGGALVQTCSKCYTQSPDSVETCPECRADLKEFSATAVSLKRFQNNTRVKSVSIAVAHDCCPACRKVEGAYDKQTAPRLPVEGCSHALGCRCYYQPVLDTIYP
jgi:hypothetical protein